MFFYLLFFKVLTENDTMNELKLYKNIAIRDIVIANKLSVYEN